MNQTIDVNISKKVFNKKYIPYLDNDSRIQIYFGGSSSGKSVFLAQRDVYKLLKGGRNILVCRQLKTTLRGSVIQEINKVITDWGMSALFEINKTDGTITCIENDYQIVFAGLDDVEKLKSITPKKGVFTDIRIEEATEVEYKSYKQLKKRLRGKTQGGLRKTITFSFNPILQTHWIYETFFSRLKWLDNQTEYQDENISILKTTYKDNLRFLEQDDIDDLENEDDKYYYDVYTLGNWGIIGEIIFTNWKYVDINDPECEYYLPEAQRTNRRYGGDFGFGGHPAAITCIHFDKNHKRIYFYDEFYMRGLTNQELAVEAIKLTGKDLSTWDSAEPKSIQELVIAGVNARGAKKGKDSVQFGVQWLQGYELIIDKKCVNTKREFSTYHNKTNKDGEVLRIPVDKDNHLIDGSRYALEDDMEERKTISMKAKVSNYLTDEK
jgi:phage terminase large subunit